MHGNTGAPFTGPDGLQLVLNSRTLHGNKGMHQSPYTFESVHLHQGYNEWIKKTLSVEDLSQINNQPETQLKKTSAKNTGDRNKKDNIGTSPCNTKIHDSSFYATLTKEIIALKGEVAKLTAEKEAVQASVIAAHAMVAEVEQHNLTCIYATTKALTATVMQAVDEALNLAEKSGLQHVVLPELEKVLDDTSQKLEDTHEAHGKLEVAAHEVTSDPSICIWNNGDGNHSHLPDKRNNGHSNEDFTVPTTKNASLHNNSPLKSESDSVVELNKDSTVPATKNASLHNSSSLDVELSEDLLANLQFKPGTEETAIVEMNTDKIGSTDPLVYNRAMMHKANFIEQFGYEIKQCKTAHSSSN